MFRTCPKCFKQFATVREVDYNCVRKGRIQKTMDVQDSDRSVTHITPVMVYEHPGCGGEMIVDIAEAKRVD